MDKPQENWISVYQQEIVREKLDDPLWLNEVLEDNNIPYRNEDRGCWREVMIPSVPQLTGLF